MVNITPMHTVSTPPGEYKYEVGTKSVVGNLINERYRPKTTTYWRYRLSSLAQESLVNITPMHTVNAPLGEYKYKVGTKSVVGNLI